MDLHVSARQQRELLSGEWMICAGVPALYHAVEVADRSCSTVNETDCQKSEAAATERSACFSWYSYLRANSVPPPVCCAEVKNCTTNEHDFDHVICEDKLQWFDDLDKQNKDAVAKASISPWKAPGIQVNGTKVVEYMKRHQLRMQKARSKRDLLCKQRQLAGCSPKRLVLNPPRKRKCFFRLNITERKAMIAKWMTGLDARLFRVNECGLMVL